MATPSVANILKTNAIAYYAPYGTALPATTVLPGIAWSAPWARWGFTAEPVALKYEADLFDVNVEEYLAAIDRLKISEKAEVETVLAETTADYVQLATQGTVTQTAAAALVYGSEALVVGNVPLLDKYVVGFEGVRYDSTGIARVVRMFLYKATFKMNGPLSFSKRSSDYVGINLMVEGLADPNNSGQIFKFQRVLADPTP